jgi:signal recognition particle GTPase
MGLWGRRAVALPVRVLGTGEGLDDLEPFDAHAYARRLVND